MLAGAAPNPAKNRWASAMAAHPRPLLPAQRPPTDGPPPQDIPEAWKMNHTGGDVHNDIPVPTHDNVDDAEVAVAIVAGVAALALVAAILTHRHSSGGGGAVGISIGGTYVQSRVLVFGGPNHHVFLGCLSCSEWDHDSVMNTTGPYGSEFGQTIFNSFSDYGSAYSNYSACNSFASDPPVIVTERGNYLGRLTVNEFSDGARDPQLNAWIGAVCAD
jgi:hypothetical protein